MTWSKQFLALTIMVAISLSAGLANADCFSQIDDLSGHFLPFQLVLVHSSDAWVSYTSGDFYYSTSTQGTTTPDGDESMLYSDRLNGSQPFYVSSPDVISEITITDGGALYYHNQTWDFDVNPTLSCVSGLTNVAVVSDGSEEIILTLGSLEIY